MGWEIPAYFQQNYHRISPKLFEDLANDAEKYLAETTKTADIITSRSQWVLVVSFTILSVCLGFLIDGQSGNYVLKLSAIVMVVLSFTSIIFLLMALWKYDIDVTGHPPSLTFDEAFVKGLEDDYVNQERLYLINKSRNIEKEIISNDLINSIRSGRLTKGLFLISISPIFSLILSYVSFQIFGELIPCL